MQKNAIVSSHLMPFIRGNLIRRFRFYNALLPVQRFFSPFWTRRRTFQRTTERRHHMEYERVCPVKFWYYNSLITKNIQVNKTAVFSKQINNFLQVLKKFQLRHKQVL
jgi:hypothetical protein